MSNIFFSSGMKKFFAWQKKSHQFTKNIFICLALKADFDDEEKNRQTDKDEKEIAMTCALSIEQRKRDWEM